MMVEYIDQQISTLSWQVAAKSADITTAESCGDHIISGSKDSISIWQFNQNNDTLDQLPIIEVANEKTHSSISKAHLIGNIAFSALTNGTVLLHELATEKLNRKSLKLVSQTKDLHSGYKCNDMLFCVQTNSVLTCGNDGSISKFNIDHPNKATSNRVSESSLRCMDLVSPNEILVGSLSGLKHIDMRTNDCVGNFANQSLSILTTIQRSPKVNHTAMGGNDQGKIILYDLRNRNTPSAVFATHNAAITKLKYKPGDTNILYSSCCDGELLKCNMSTDFSGTLVIRKVESISGLTDPISINSFDVNHLGDMVFTTDIGSVVYKKVNEFGT